MVRVNGRGIGNFPLAVNAKGQAYWVPQVPIYANTLELIPTRKIGQYHTWKKEK